MPTSSTTLRKFTGALTRVLGYWFVGGLALLGLTALAGKLWPAPWLELAFTASLFVAVFVLFLAGVAFGLTGVGLCLARWERSRSAALNGLFGGLLLGLLSLALFVGALAAVLARLMS